MYVSAILLAAGRGVRFSPRISKPLVKIDSKPLIAYSLVALDRHPCIKDIIVVANALNKKDILKIIKQYGAGKVRDVVPGGERRQDSVRNGLEAIDSRAGLVLIHDSARPFIGKTDISAVIKEAKKCGAAILGVPVRATIKKSSSLSAHSFSGSPVVKETVSRDNLWEIQTPQVFKKGLISKAYKKYGRSPATDDSMLVEKMGIKVNLVTGSYANIKITTREDLILAEAIAKVFRKSR